MQIGKYAATLLTLTSLLNPNMANSNERLEKQIQILLDSKQDMESNTKKYKKEIAKLEKLAGDGHFILKNGKYNPSNHAEFPNGMIDTVDDLCKKDKTGWCEACRPVLNRSQSIILKSGNYKYGDQNYHGIFVLTYNLELNSISMAFYPKNREGYERYNMGISEYFDKELAEKKLSECKPK